MADEITTPDHKTFDLASALLGRSYPENTVTVYLDEERLVLLTRSNNARRELEVRNDEEALAELDKETEQLRKDLDDSKYLVRIKGVDRDRARRLVEQVEAEYPTEYNPIGQPKPNPEQDEAFNNRQWALYIDHIENSKGERSEMNEQLAGLFRGMAPISAIRAIDQAISVLVSEAQTGYENAVKDTDFLSGA